MVGGKGWTSKQILILPPPSPNLCSTCVFLAGFDGGWPDGRFWPGTEHLRESHGSEWNSRHRAVQCSSACRALAPVLTVESFPVGFMQTWICGKMMENLFGTALAPWYHQAGYIPPETWRKQRWQPQGVPWMNEAIEWWRWCILDPSKGYCNMTDIHENVHKNLRLWGFSGAMIHSLIHHAFVLPNTAASRVCHCILDTTHLGFLWWTCRITCVYMKMSIYIHICIYLYLYMHSYIHVKGLTWFDIYL